MQGKQEYQPALFATIQIENVIPPNHLLRKFDETLDLSFVRPLTESLYSKGNGRPSIDPEVFVRMLLIEYLYDIPSDRQLCEEIGFNLVYRWFCRFSLEDAIPDHSSMTRIRDRLGEETFKRIFLHIVNLCEDKGLVKGKRVMTDGSYIKANAALSSLVEREVKSADPEKAPEVGEKDQDAPKQDSAAPDDKTRSKSIKGKTFSNKTHVSQTDPDSTLAGKDHETKLLRHKLHQSCDADSRVILDCHVTTGALTDGTVYIGRLKEIEKTFGFQIEEAIADRGYGYGENLQYLKDKGIRSFVPRFRTDVGESIDREKTPYNAEKNEFYCELGNPLPRVSVNVKKKMMSYRPAWWSCDACERKSYCVIKRRGLRVSPYHQVHFEALQMEKTQEYKERRRERMWKAEGLFAEGKTFHGLSRARYRGRWKMQVQAYLTSSVQNLKRLIRAVLPQLGPNCWTEDSIFNIFCFSFFDRSPDDLLLRAA